MAHPLKGGAMHGPNRRRGTMRHTRALPRSTRGAASVPSMVQGDKTAQGHHLVEHGNGRSCPPPALNEQLGRGFKGLMRDSRVTPDPSAAETIEI